MVTDAEVVDRARRLLDDLSTGELTRPSRLLYPHQWSWDAGFIAIGLARVDQEAAQRELRSLFRGQWSNGMVPHIVFDPHTQEGYFPGPAFWSTARSPHASRRPPTSGLVQPPIHATAVRHVYERASDRESALAFAEEMVPKLAAWHDYLHRERCRSTRLSEIWHPWESGMDNSPLWDEALERLVPHDLPHYRREDLRVACAEERPTDVEYDRYVHLVDLMRRLAYRPDRIRAGTPFAIWDVMWNSLLVQADRDLGMLCRAVGADPSGYEEWADAVAAEVEARLWHPERAAYANVDVLTGAWSPVPAGSVFIPLFAGIPDEQRAGVLVDHLARFSVEWNGGRLVPSLDVHHPGFLPRRYWRGPVWINVNWLIYRGLLRYGFTGLAGQLRHGMLELVRRSGFWEHYHPLSGEGGGAEGFAWSAALTLEVVQEGQ